MIASTKPVAKKPLDRDLCAELLQSWFRKHRVCGGRRQRRGDEIRSEDRAGAQLLTKRKSLT